MVGIELLWWWLIVIGIPLSLGGVTVALLPGTLLGRLLWGGIASLVVFGLLSNVAFIAKTRLNAELFEIQNKAISPEKGQGSAGRDTKSRPSGHEQSSAENAFVGAIASTVTDKAAGVTALGKYLFTAYTTWPWDNDVDRSVSQRKRDIDEKVRKLSKQQLGKQQRVDAVAEMKKELEWLMRNILLLREDVNRQIDRQWTIMMGSWGGILVLLAGVAINGLTRRGG
ncbi:MAG: hypothetical protein AB7G08_26210 [Hyphomicrobiaceae bacterium]